jgi:hypothetical protein
MKQLKVTSVIGMLALATVTATPVAAQSAFPSAAQEFSSHFWSESMMRAMDDNRDGRVSRQEFLTYMGHQYDTMDSGKKGMLTSQQFTDRKMMARTFAFPSSAPETGSLR